MATFASKFSGRHQAWLGPAEVVRAVQIPGLDRAAEEAASERRVGDEPDAERATRRWPRS
jgi:hypothetical protein